MFLKEYFSLVMEIKTTGENIHKKSADLNMKKRKYNISSFILFFG
jgi:hypothetical protein